MAWYRPSFASHLVPASTTPFELLSPAGNWDCARAAVENGADAIYFGLESGFNARGRATNFSSEDLHPLMTYLHQRGVRGYVTLNTLVFCDELDDVTEHVIRIANSGVDAVLVQDLGIVKLIRAICSDLEIHASTQMTLTSGEGMEVARQLGLARVVLPRELSIHEIEQLSRRTELGLEAFVHGALCVAYSGQCLTSEALGGRSANRGQCAQACRLPYEVICDGEDVALDDVRYLLSPQDLAAYALIPDLIQAGVRSFKIEGRLKTPEYVANATQHYRRALDDAIAGIQSSWTKQEIEELELSFSRGLSPGWLNGCDHKMLVPGLSSSKRGVLAGEVIAIQDQTVRVRLACSLRAGDGVVFDGDRAIGSEQGGRVWKITKDGVDIRGAVDGETVELQFQGDEILEFLYIGQRMWKTDDPRQTKRLRATFTGPDPVRKTSLDLRVHAAVGESLVVVGKTVTGAECRVSSDEPLPLARRHVITEDVVRKQLSRLGNTVYQLRRLDLNVDGQPMVPLSVLGKVRREMVRQLDASALTVRQVTVHDNALEQIRIECRSPRTATADRKMAGNTEPRLHVLCRHLQQIPAAIESGVTDLICDFADIRDYKQAVDIAQTADVSLLLATPRIDKPGETGVFTLIARQSPDGVLVRNLGGLSFFHQHGIPFVADFSLNAANQITVDILHAWGAQRVTPSYDLNRDQMLELVATTQVDRLEIVIHQHMPMFHMEHCVFCAVLSPGTNKTNCGRPCDDHMVQLRDRVGMEHPLHADVGCRNTLFNAVPQSSAEITGTLIDRAVQHFRIELLDDSPQESQTVIQTYQQLLQGKITGKEVWQRLKVANRVGVTRGTLEERRNPLAII
jgi:putative protease